MIMRSTERIATLALTSLVMGVLARECLHSASSIT